MKLSREQIEHIALLARLELKDEEKDLFAQQLSSVLDYMEILNEVDTKEIAPTLQVTGLKTIWREDEVKPCEHKTRELILQNFPAREGNFLKVPLIFE